MRKSVLVTGGLGYIGSHTVVKLIEKGYHVITMDNTINSNIEVLDRIEKITGIRPTHYQYDITAYGTFDPIFRNFDVDSVIHFAAFKSVSASIYSPIQYYENNVGGLTNLLSAMHQLLRILYSLHRVQFMGNQTTIQYMKKPQQNYLKLLTVLVNICVSKYLKILLHKLIPLLSDTLTLLVIMNLP
jgi:UDP-glucose 4-epimerase